MVQAIVNRAAEIEGTNRHERRNDHGRHGASRALTPASILASWKAAARDFVAHFTVRESRSSSRRTIGMIAAEPGCCMSAC